jgi:uncharacterized protein YbjT (DUF2867 family)
MKVAVFGGTGYVGSYLVDRLIAGGHIPRLLVRPGSERKLRQPERCEVVNGEIEESAAVARCMVGADAAIYLIGLLREFPAKGITWEAAHYAGAVAAMNAALDHGVRRFLLMSANGARPGGTGYQSTKYRAEQHLASTALGWTVFRPSVMFGDPRGQMEFCTQLKDEMVMRPVPAPLFHEGLWPGGAGRFRMSPVAVEDVAGAFVQSLETPASHGRVLPLCGPEALEWREILATIAAACGRKKLMLPAPAGIIGAVAGVLDRFEWFPVTKAQLQMLLEGNVCDGRDAWTMFGIEPQRFDEAALAYLNR